MKNTLVNYCKNLHQVCSELQKSVSTGHIKKETFLNDQQVTQSMVK